MELHLAARLNGSFPGRERCEHYLGRLPLAQEQRDAILAQLAELDVSSTREAMAALHIALAGHGSDADPVNPAVASIDSRLALGKSELPPTTGTGPETVAQSTLPTSPPINRSSMAPLRWPPGPAFVCSNRGGSGMAQVVPRPARIRRIPALPQVAGRLPPICDVWHCWYWWLPRSTFSPAPWLRCCLITATGCWRLPS